MAKDAKPNIPDLKDEYNYSKNWSISDPPGSNYHGTSVHNGYGADNLQTFIDGTINRHSDYSINLSYNTDSWYSMTFKEKTGRLFGYVTEYHDSGGGTYGDISISRLNSNGTYTLVSSATVSQWSWIKLADSLEAGTYRFTPSGGRGYRPMTEIYIERHLESRICLVNDNTYIIPTKDYFDVNTKTFAPLSINDIAYNECVLLKDINNRFIIDDTEYIPSDYINITDYKICYITSNKIDSFHFEYNCANIKDISVKPYFEEKNKRKYLNYYCKYDDTLYEQYKYGIYKFKDFKDSIKSVSLYIENYNKVLLNDYQDFLYDNKRYIKFLNSHKKIIISKTYNQEYKYVKDTLDKF